MLSSFSNSLASRIGLVILGVLTIVLLLRMSRS